MTVKKVLGTTKLSGDNKMTLIEPVAGILKAKKGDLIVFYLVDGKVCIEVA